MFYVQNTSAEIASQNQKNETHVAPHIVTGVHSKSSPGRKLPNAFLNDFDLARKFVKGCKNVKTYF